MSQSFETSQSAKGNPAQETEKFRHPDITAKGEPRASVPLVALETLWINTGSLCNITCRHCFMESSPRNDSLAYVTLEEARALYDEIAQLRLPTRQIGFTGGEPFLNRDFLPMVAEALARGFSVLILTNAMRPLQRPRVQAGLMELKERFGDRLALRVSLDHYTQARHESERGVGSWAMTVAGIDWLVAHGFSVAIAGRTRWGEPETATREGYAQLFAERGWPLTARDPAQLVLFPEMDETADVPEITTACWGILGVRPDAMMCATSRMVVKRKGADHLTVLPCTLLPYAAAFEMGHSLAEAAKAHGGMFHKGAVKLCHPHCAKFCVLGGGSCSIA